MGPAQVVAGRGGGGGGEGGGAGSVVVGVGAVRAVVDVGGARWMSLVDKKQHYYIIDI